jgi:hypothetical protein
MKNLINVIKSWSPWHLRQHLKATQLLYLQEVTAHQETQSLLNKILLNSIEPPHTLHTLSEQNFSHNLF